MKKKILFIRITNKNKKKPYERYNIGRIRRLNFFKRKSYASPRNLPEICIKRFFFFSRPLCADARVRLVFLLQRLHFLMALRFVYKENTYKRTYTTVILLLVYYVNRLLIEPYLRIESVYFCPLVSTKRIKYILSVCVWTKMKMNL